MRRFLHKVFVVGTMFAIALSCGPFSREVGAAEKKDDKAVLDEVLDILKEKGQLTEEKYQELKTRAKKEGAGKILAGFDGVTPYIKSVDGQHTIKLNGRLNFDLRAYEEGARNLNGTDLITNFRVRRARIGVDATFFKYLGIKVEGDFGEGGGTAYRRIRRVEVLAGVPGQGRPVQGAVQLRGADLLPVH